VSSVKNGGMIELRLGSPDGKLIGVLNVPNTGGYDNWKLCSTSIENTQGVHDLFFVFKGEAKNDLFKFDFWQFEEAQSRNGE
jgi:arabinoxylan arabinofuranohydrolase